MQYQERLSSFAEVTAAGDKNVYDPSRLPSYRETRRFRFHPYHRPVPVPQADNEVDRLLNTIYDDECVMLDAPQRLSAPPTVTHPLEPLSTDEFEECLRHNIEGAIAFELRVQRLSPVIVEFAAGITRATT